jgi:hypothetical protein
MVGMLGHQDALQNILQLVLHAPYQLRVSQARSVCGYNDNSTKQTNLGVAEVEPVDPLGQLKHVVHEELGVAGWHCRYRLPPYHITVHAHQALIIKKTG